jgi:hypothetical protein
LPDAFADVVTAGQCWHWFNGTRAAQESRRILKRDGRIVIAHFDWIPLRVNVVEATVTVPSFLSITSAGTGGSLCSIWVQQPTVSGSNVSFKCGIPGGTTGNGTVVTISVHANATGTGNVIISGGRVLAGPGQDVTGSSTNGSVTITTAASQPAGQPRSPVPGQPVTATPSIASGPYSDQNKWYRTNSPSFSWNQDAGITNFAYAFDQNPNTYPDATVTTTGTSVTFSNQSDGIWYFHLRAYSANGWSPVITQKVQIDTTAPTGLTVITEPKEIADKRPMVSFAATDATSGIDHYELSTDGGEFKTTASPYTPETITSGKHTFTVRAFDKAGNQAETTAAITIKDISSPTITDPPTDTTLKLIEKIDISGTADPSTTIDLFIDDKPVAQAIKVSANGKWSYTYQSVLFSGSHKLHAIAVKDGIKSQASNVVAIKIDPTAISLFGHTISIYIIIALLLGIIAILVAIIICLIAKLRRRHYRRQTKSARHWRNFFHELIKRS